jgi:serine/threonine protein kinase
VTSLAALQPGDPQRIGPYVLLGRLGSGGMGRVYLARSPGGRMVAVKVIRANLAEDAGFRARFAREVSAAAKVGGLFTAAVVDADVDGPVPWLVTAYVPGTSLSDAVERQGPLPENSVLALAAGLAEGLIAIHAAGVIHRDLKPSNVLLAQDGPRIIDFGISSAAGATSLTGTGFMIGSPGFMSPEQAEGLTVGPASDIFSLAGVLIYAARGEGPFGTGDTAALLYRVVHGKPNTDHVPDNLKPLIKRSLSRDPKRRPTATQFLTELSAAYPAAADLSNWLPAQILNENAARSAPSEASLHPPGGSLAGGSVPRLPSMADPIAPAADPVAPAADPVAPVAMAAGAREAEPGTGGPPDDPPTRTSLSTPTPAPPTPYPTGPLGYPSSTGQPAQGYPGPQSYAGQQGYQGQQAYQGEQYPSQQGYASQPGYADSQAYPGQQQYSGQQQYAEPQGYQTGQRGAADPVAPGGSQGGSQGGWWGGQQPGGPQPDVPGEWYSPGGPSGTTSQPPRKRPKWLIPAGAAAAIVAIAVVLVLTLGSGSSNKGNAGSGPATTPAQTHSASPQATPTVGELQLAQLQIGDCLTGANLQLNSSAPWPKLSKAVPCTEDHTAEVFYANNNYWGKGASYPGNATIKKDATAACDSAFASYVGITYSKSLYTWTDVVPDASTWPGGDRALHCVVYYATSSQPSGVTLHESLKGAAK